MKKLFPVIANYTSEIDHFLLEFDKKHTKLSPSQQAEWKKYQNIYRKRDTVTNQK